MRCVVDTNVLISRLLRANSLPAQAVRHITQSGILLVSEATLEEFADVLARPKFDPYVTLEERQGFLERLIRITEHVPILRRVQACRDPKDNKFLEVAVNGQADVIITGDEDLLILDPYMTIPIVTPNTYLQQQSEK